MAPSKPRHLLTASGKKDIESTLIPTFYREGRVVPSIHSRPFTCAGAPGRLKPRRVAPEVRPATASQISDHPYEGRYKKPERWMCSAEGKQPDLRKTWHCTNKPPSSINPHSLATADAWALLRPAVSKSLVQMGVYYTNRL